MSEEKGGNEGVVQRDTYALKDIGITGESV